NPVDVAPRRVVGRAGRTVAISVAKLELVPRVHHRIDGLELEAHLLAHALHVAVVRKDAGEDGAQVFTAADLHETFQEFTAQSEVLPLVSDDDRELGFTAVERFAEPAHCHDGTSAVFVAVFRNERQVAVVVGEANPYETFVGGPRVELESMRVALPDAPFTESIVKVYHQGLAFRQSGPDRDGGRVLESPRCDILR